MIRFGVLGTARVVPFALLTAARETPGVEVTAVASRSLEKAQAYAAAHNIGRAFGSYDTLVDSTDIEAVYIGLPTALHHEWARRALQAGKHVLCEKPLAANAQLVEDLVACAKQSNRILLEGMHMYYFGPIRRLREKILSGEFGRVRRIDSCFRATFARMIKGDFRMSFELGGGSTLDLGCYAVSLLRYVAGEEPEVTCARAKCSRPEVDRWMRAELRFPSGAEGSVECGFRGLYTPRVGIEVICEGGAIRWAGGVLKITKEGQQIEERVAPTPTFLLQLQNFLKAVAGEESDLFSLQDSLRTARVLDEMYRKAGLELRGNAKA